MYISSQKYEKWVSYTPAPIHLVPPSPQEPQLLVTWEPFQINTHRLVKKYQVSITRKINSRALVYRRAITGNKTYYILKAAL